VNLTITSDPGDHLLRHHDAKVVTDSALDVRIPLGKNPQNLEFTLRSLVRTGTGEHR